MTELFISLSPCHRSAFSVYALSGTLPLLPGSPCPAVPLLPGSSCPAVPLLPAGTGGLHLSHPPRAHLPGCSDLLLPSLQVH